MHAEEQQQQDACILYLSYSYVHKELTPICHTASRLVVVDREREREDL